VSTISTFPVGLLSLLGIQNDGKYPQSLNANYQPVLDLLDWIGRSNAEELVSFQYPVLASLGEKTDDLATVPQNEVWILKGGACSTALGVAEALQATMFIGRPVGSAVYTFNAGRPAGYPLGVYGGAASAFRAYIDGPVLMFPGDVVGLSVHLFVGGAIAPFQNILIKRFHL
jgi:hypothetical protein